MSFKCDICTLVSTDVVQCVECGGIMCESCYNRTCGGNCHFISNTEMHHSPNHKIILFTPIEIKISKPSCTTYITLSHPNEEKCIVNLDKGETRLCSCIVNVFPSLNKQSNLGLPGKGIDSLLKYIHCSQELIEYKFNPEVRGEQKETEFVVGPQECKSSETLSITCKGYEFRLHLRELMESMDYTDKLINKIICSLLSPTKDYKKITFGTVISPYTLTTSLPIVHSLGTYVVWQGDTPGEITSEEERVRLLREMIKPFKSASKIPYQESSFSRLFTIAQLM